MWKHISKGTQKQIILHDCFLNKVRFENNDLVFEFDDSGFWVCPSHPNNPYETAYGAGKSELRLTNVDLCSDLILFNKFRFLSGLFNKALHSRTEVSLQTFASKINIGEWKYEFVDEYYSNNGVMFCGYIYPVKNSNSIYTQMEILFDENIYYWNDIDMNRPW